jgi:hypothetical protein
MLDRTSVNEIMRISTEVKVIDMLLHRQLQESALGPVLNGPR